MDFLLLEERTQLQEILLKNSYLQTTDAATRRALLENCGLKDCCDLPGLDQPLRSFIIILFSELSKTLVQIGSTETLGLVAFLEYISSSPEIIKLKDEEISFIKIIISKWKSSERSYQTQKRKKYIESLLDKARNSSLKEGKIKSSAKVDRSIITNFDLNSLIIKFRRKVKYKGIFTFAIGGDERILEEYIIERLRQELEFFTKRKSESLEIQLHKGNILSYENVQHELINKYGLDSFESFPDISICNDIFIIVWNFDIPKKAFQELAKDFLKSLNTHILPALTRQNRCLILVWANLNKKPLSGFTTLPTPSNFDLPELLSWFSSRLKQEGIPESLIERCLSRLKTQNGHLGGTYREMNAIVRELQGGNKLYG